jgi:stage V sporulation protein B
VAYILAAVLNLAAVRRHTGTRFDIWLTYIKPAAAAVIMSAVVLAVYAALHALTGMSALPTVISVAIGAVAYAAFIFLSGAITEEELLLLPKGRVVVRLLNALRGKRH